MSSPLDQYIENLRDAIRALELANKRIEEGKADRAELLVVIYTAFDMIRNSAMNWMGWLSSRDKMLSIPQDELLRVWRNVYPHIKALLEEDLRHTSWFNANARELMKHPLLYIPQQAQRSIAQQHE